MAGEKEDSGKKKVNVQILGRRYTLRAGNDPEYVSRLAAFVDDRMRQLMDASRSLPLQDVAILTAINITDDLMKARDRIAALEAGEFTGEVSEGVFLEGIHERLGNLLSRLPKE